MSGYEIHLIWHTRLGCFSGKVYTINALRVSGLNQLMDLIQKEKLATDA